MENFKKHIGLKIVIMAVLFLTVFMVSACSTVDENSDVAVTSIAVTSTDNVTTITEIGGTLQMNANVSPSNATDKAYTWSVIDGTGQATISSTGLLTGVEVGTVTVNATLTSKTSIRGSKLITISNEPTVDMDSTLTELLIDGQSVLEFNPAVSNYVHVLTAGETSTPTVTTSQFETTSVVVITDAIDVTSTDVLDRTTTIEVTTTDDVVKTYYIVFETQIAPVDLGTAGDFVVLAETGVAIATTSSITGDIGVSPAAATYITGLSLIVDASLEYSTSSQVVGNIYASDYAVPTPTKLTTAVADMHIAYTDAAGRSANYTELYSGDLSGKTLTPGVFKFGNSVLINTDLTLTGSSTDVWIFQIAGGLTMASDVNIILAGGADAKNIFWQVADTVSIGSGSHFEGTILAMTNITIETNASVHGRLYAQTAVTLDAVTVVKSND